MRWFRFAVLILAATVLQASVFDGWNIRPDLLLILMVFFSIHCNQKDAIITSFTIGFAADIIGSAMGPQIISFGFFGTLLSYLHGVIPIKKMPYQAIVIFISGVLTGVLSHLLTLLKGQPETANIYTSFLWIPLYSGIIGPFLFLPTAWLMRIKISRFK
jgi:rod shape-determining protein MreD